LYLTHVHGISLRQITPISNILIRRVCNETRKTEALVSYYTTR